ncbi:hypothetical protein RRG48_04875 [Mycoplasmopsis canis]|uniref:hypothetical protein n=1 Tax=Mycoplasmopsis cynos TaxID=171284 RepID=UPI002AFF3ECD|nr:hypothetical protein [Mycoplasmopsis cynos]WQQ13438.1 hypothetical protein RRG58_01685 [Mycoplasmopsis cynos]WQQ13713.1 hypothetical protein RRG52_03095 [Mycoplasmopsis cynos]
MNKLIVWALFDDANRSIYKALQNDNDVVVYSFGINDKENENNYIKIDLSLNNKTLVQDINKLIKKVGAPDIVFASPPCRAWTTANPGKALKNILENGNLELKNYSHFITYNEYAQWYAKRDFFKEQSSILEAQSTTLATILILQLLKPKIFFIENPQGSRIFKYINSFCNFETINNKLHYFAYDKNFPKKATTFASNYYFDTKTTKEKSNIKMINLGNYNDRSAIPNELIIDLIFQSKGIIWKKKN